MAYSITCTDAGEDCAFACTAPTEEELMQHIQMHASVGHPGMELTPEKISQVQGVIRTVWLRSARCCQGGDQPQTRLEACRTRPWCCRCSGDVNESHHGAAAWRTLVLAATGPFLVAADTFGPKSLVHYEPSYSRLSRLTGQDQPRHHAL